MGRWVGDCIDGCKELWKPVTVLRSDSDYNAIRSAPLGQRKVRGFCRKHPKSLVTSVANNSCCKKPENEIMR